LRPQITQIVKIRKEEIISVAYRLIDLFASVFSRRMYRHSLLALVLARPD